MELGSLSGVLTRMSQIADAYGAIAGQLASGARLVAADHGAAELAVAEGLSAQLAQTHQGMRNLTDGISMLQTADGALGTVSDNLVRMKALAMQAQGGVLSEQQRQLVAAEINQLAAMNAQIAAMTEFNGVNLFEDGGAITIEAGQAAFTIDLQGVAQVTGDATMDGEAVTASIEMAEDAVNAHRGTLGAEMTRMENYSENLHVQAESLMASQSAIRDMDMAQIAAAETSKQIIAMQVYAAQAHNRTVTEIAAMFFAR